MKLITTIIMTLLWVLNSQAQEFGTHWVSYPLPNDSCEVWYRKLYKLDAQPFSASVSLASTGNLRLYINERNVTGSAFYEGMKDSTVMMRTFDITRFLKKGENIIAVWYAPAGSANKDKQLSLDFYGWDQDTIPFHHQADGTWWCKQLPECRVKEREYFDKSEYTNEWKSAEYRSHGWLHPTGSFEGSKSNNMIEYTPLRTENKLNMVLYPTNIYSDSLGYHVDFGRTFRGTIRLTIRDAHKGDLIDIDGNQYICSGEMDEQAFFRFHCEERKVYTLNWSKRFKKSYITNIEGLEISR